MTAAIVTERLGKRYGSTWALRDVTLAVPAGRVSALVGANGAGKSTLLRLLAGVSRPTTGAATVAGQAPGDDLGFLRRIGYVAQDIPLYRRWSVADHLTLGARLNETWDAGGARARLSDLGIPGERRVAALSGGMRAQLALALALGKRPDVLLLDEPLAALDPLARRDFMACVVEAVAERPLTVVLSSHLLPDLERICDHLIVVADGRLVLAADIDDVRATHRVVVTPGLDTTVLERDHDVVSISRTPRQVSALVRLRGAVVHPGWDVTEVSLEEIVLGYLASGRRGEPQAADTRLALIEDGR